jgi:hypothetical protein
MVENFISTVESSSAIAEIFGKQIYPGSISILDSFE